MMDAEVFILVLAAAAMHAGWNAVLKLGVDRSLSITLIAGSAGLISLAGLPFVPTPHVQAWPWLALSMALHVGYNHYLVKTYQTGDLGQMYAIARGGAPLMVMLATLFLPGERPGAAGVAGVLLLVAGIWLMSLRGGRSLAKVPRAALGSALLTSAFIAGYTLADGLGARNSGSAHGYTLWLFVINGLAMLLMLAARRGGDGLRALAPYWRAGLLGGAMSLGAYWIAIWAMSRAPIAMVAALRESSVLFAALLSVLILREPLTRWRLLAALIITAGVVIMRLA